MPGPRLQASEWLWGLLGPCLPTSQHTLRPVPALRAAQASPRHGYHEHPPWWFWRAGAISPPHGGLHPPWPMTPLRAGTSPGCLQLHCSLGLLWAGMGSTGGWQRAAASAPIPGDSSGSSVASHGSKQDRPGSFCNNPAPEGLCWLSTHCVCPLPRPVAGTHPPPGPWAGEQVGWGLQHPWDMGSGTHCAPLLCIPPGSRMMTRR